MESVRPPDLPGDQPERVQKSEESITQIQVQASLDEDGFNLKFSAAKHQMNSHTMALCI